MIITGSARKGVLVLVVDEIQAQVDRLSGVILALEPSDKDGAVPVGPWLVASLQLASALTGSLPLLCRLVDVNNHAVPVLLSCNVLARGQLDEDSVNRSIEARRLCKATHMEPSSQDRSAPFGRRLPAKSKLYRTTRRSSSLSGVVSTARKWRSRARKTRQRSGDDSLRDEV